MAYVQFHKKMSKNEEWGTNTLNIRKDTVAQEIHTFHFMNEPIDLNLNH